MPSAAIASATDRDIYTVSRLNREARMVLEGGFTLIRVEGEISNLARPASGHLYFTLKDDQAQVRCAMFRMRRNRLRFEPQNGMQVCALARVTLYETRGEFQLVVEGLQQAGDGALQRRFEALKRKLFQEGLFALERKQPVPAFPRRIALLTSAAGAAVRDVLTVLARRCPSIEVLIYPTQVQGEGAAADITATLQLAGKRRDCDVILLVRGGGSFEDLDAYNDEALARAIAGCPLPVVTGIGHEIDFTIADFVADRRAPTPSAAAELLSPDRTELQQRLAACQQRLVGQIRTLQQREERRLDWMQQRLARQHPGHRLRERAQRLDELELRLGYLQQQQMRQRAARLGELTSHLHRLSPAHRLATWRATLEGLAPRLIRVTLTRLDREQQRTATLCRALHTVSPLATLGRGYSIVTRVRDGRIVRQVAQVCVGERIDARLQAGRLRCIVEDTAGDGGD